MSPSRAFAVLVFFFSVLFAASSAMAQQAQRGGLTVPVAGTGVLAPGEASGAITGTFKIERFVSTAEGVFAVGLVTVTNAAGTTAVVKNATAQVQTPGGNGVVAQQATCEILNLVLGPLHLDLLGLVIDLNQVVLNITAVAGAGNLLGNLLCAIVGLLDGTGASVFAELARLLNQLLGLLG